MVNACNLIYLNCSRSGALDVALEEMLLKEGPAWRTFVRVIFNPEIWVASQLRRRADMLAWTPGLILDYACAMRVAVNPPPLDWRAIGRSIGLLFQRKHG